MLISVESLKALEDFSSIQSIVTLEFEEDIDSQDCAEAWYKTFLITQILGFEREVERVEGYRRGKMWGVVGNGMDRGKEWR
ncbi:hypothetical protein Tco_1304099 [Tanacetum coccineum]